MSTPGYKLIPALWWRTREQTGADSLPWRPTPLLVAHVVSELALWVWAVVALWLGAPGELKRSDALYVPGLDATGSAVVAIAVLVLRLVAAAAHYNLSGEAVRRLGATGHGTMVPLRFLASAANRTSRHLNAALQKQLAKMAAPELESSEPDTEERELLSKTMQFYLEAFHMGQQAEAKQEADDLAARAEDKRRQLFKGKDAKASSQAPLKSEGDATPAHHGEPRPSQAGGGLAVVNEDGGSSDEGEAEAKGGPPDDSHNEPITTAVADRTDPERATLDVGGSSEPDGHGGSTDDDYTEEWPRTGVSAEYAAGQHSAADQDAAGHDEPYSISAAQSGGALYDIGAANDGYVIQLGDGAGTADELGSRPAITPLRAAEQAQATAGSWEWSATAQDWVWHGQWGDEGGGTDWEWGYDGQNADDGGTGAESARQDTDYESAAGYLEAAFGYGDGDDSAPGDVHDQDAGYVGDAPGVAPLSGDYNASGNWDTWSDADTAAGYQPYATEDFTTTAATTDNYGASVQTGADYAYDAPPTPDWAEAALGGYAIDAGVADTADGDDYVPGDAATGDSQATRDTDRGGQDAAASPSHTMPWDAVPGTSTSFHDARRE